MLVVIRDQGNEASGRKLSTKVAKSSISAMVLEVAPTLVEVTLEKVNHGKLKFTMVNGTSSVTPNFQFTMVNLTLVSCPDNSGKNKVDVTPDNNLVTKKKKSGYISCLSKPCLFS